MLRLIGILLIWAIGAGSLFAADTGSLRGRFVVDMKLPVGVSLFDGTVAIGRDGGIQGCYVYMLGKEPRGLDDPPFAPVCLVTRNGRFDSEFIVSGPRQKLFIFNSGQSVGRMQIDIGKGNFQVDVYPGSLKRYELPPDPPYEVRVNDLFSTRPVASVRVTENRFVAATDWNGYFLISDIPTGHHDFECRCLNAQKPLNPAWKQDGFSVEITAGKTTDLGEDPRKSMPSVFHLTEGLFNKLSNTNPK